MADTKISAMTSASTLTGAELVPLVQSGVNVQTTLSTLAGYTTPTAYIEVADVTSNFSLPTTPTVLTGTSSPATNIAVVSNSGITYDPATGIFTFAKAGSYSLSISINVQAANAGQQIYWYAENNTGSGWTVNTNSGKEFSTVNNTRTQVFAANSIRRTAGQQVRYYFWASTSNINVATVTLPGSTAIVPGIRIQYAGF